MPVTPPTATTPREALAFHGVSQEEPLVPVEDGGLVNRTWAVGAPAHLVLQQVNAIFPPATHARIAVVTEHLHRRGLLTPRLVPARDGSLTIPGPEGTCWRVMSWVPGVTWHRVPTPAHAREAASLVARFHDAVGALTAELPPLRPGAHDTVAHMGRLEDVLGHTGEHRLRDGIRATGQAILAGWDRMRHEVGEGDGPLRMAHGDLKISNVRFGPCGGRAACLIDLDTLGGLPLALELGDALRSWCNRGGEDEAEVALDLEIFQAAVEGYLGTAEAVTDGERAGLVPGLWRIALELAARFCIDAYHERYFAWNPRVAPGRGEHNLLRARGQLALARAVEAARPDLEARVGSIRIGG